MYVGIATRQQLTQLNRLYKEIDDIYHNISSEMGISDSAMIILYGLRHAGRPCTQKELCETWYVKKQTVHSAINKLIQSGYVRMEPLPENPRIKLANLTEKGFEFSEKTVIPLLNAEQAAFDRLTTEEREMLLALTQKQVNFMHEEAKKLLERYNYQESCTPFGGLAKHEESESKKKKD